MWNNRPVIEAGASQHDLFLVACAAGTVLLLLLLIARVRLHPALALVVGALGLGIASHVNDPGFWMIQSFFKLEIKETLGTWTVLETVLSLAGLLGTLALAAVLR